MRAACRRWLTKAIGLLLVATVLAQSKSPETIQKRITPHVVLFQEISTDPPLAVQGLRITPSRAVRIVTVLGNDVVLAENGTRGREPVSRAAWRHRALAALNADFFPYTGDPLGLCIVRGELVSEPFPNRPAIGWGVGGKVVIGAPLLDAVVIRADGAETPLTGINRPARAESDLVLYTNFFGTMAQSEASGVAVVLDALPRPLRVGAMVQAVVREVLPNASRVPIPPTGGVLLGTGNAGAFLQALQPGQAVQIRLDLKGDGASAWREVTEAIAGGPWLVRNGKPVAPEEYEQAGFNRGFWERRHPRTAVGRTAKGELLWLVVDGRQAHSQGVSLPELAQLMLRYGAVDAINLDGGGSSTLVVRDLLLNSPSDGSERPVANLWLLFDDSLRPALPRATYRIEPPAATLKVGEQVRFRIWRDSEPVSTWDALWGCNTGLGFIDQWGRFTALRPGQGTISVYIDHQWLHAPLVVEAPPVPAEPNKNGGAGGNRTHE
ncbi:MAG: phosphodiester glycosidase family protein [Armatimonadota bacterium]